MIRKALLLKFLDAAYMQRWNDKIRPVELIELDKQAHKMIVAWFLARVEEDRGTPVSWTRLIEGGIFELLQRIVITDLKPQIFYKIKELDRPSLKKRVDEALATYRRSDARLRALQAPPTVERDHQEYLAAIALTVVLVVGVEEGARGLLLGSYASGAVFVLGLIWVHRRRLSLRIDRPLLRRLLRFGLPTMPAELSLYALNFVDRVIIARSLGLAEAGLYALAVKFAQAVNVLVRGFQLAWPPLAYSIREDGEARRVYAAVVTWFTAGCTFVVVGMWLLSRWIVRALAAPKFFEAFEPIGLLAAGVTLYALYMVLVVILGRTGRTEFNFPATAAALAANVALNLILVPAFGIVGAAVALVASYLVVLALMYGFTQRLFPVPYEWARLARVVFAAAALVAAGELLLPTAGASGLLSRSALWLAYPLALFASGFFTPAERHWLAGLRHPAELFERLRGLRPSPAVDGRIPEAYEAELLDEDSRL